MKTLTPQILGMYIGQKMILEKSGRIATIQGVQDLGGDLFIDDGEDFRSHEYFPFKPILRRLSDMTEEEIWNMALMDAVSGHKMKLSRANVSGKLIQVEFLDDGQLSVMHWSFNRMSAPMFNYLRSIGIDCDNLLDSGLAVENNQHPIK